VTPDPDDEMIDGRYVLGPVIGRGAMAEVRSAQDVRLARAVAVKLLQTSLSMQREARLRFEEEARAVARLSDPDVVAVYDSGEHLGRPYIVMELLPGRTLHDELREGPLAEARAREVIVRVLRALRAAHRAGVIHRDIKPANILLTASGDAKVADFGIAKVAGSTDLTATGLLLGTPSYLAPECVSGHAATVASDLYAAGVVLYEALSGRRPFLGDTPLAVCHAICTDEPRPLGDLAPHVSGQLSTVVTRAMAKNPQQRYRSADDMLEALARERAPVRSLADEPIQAVEPEPTLVAGATRTQVFEPQASAAAVGRPGRDWTRRHIKLLVAAAALVIGAGVVFDLGSHRSDTSTSTPTVQTVTTVPATVPAASTSPPATVALPPSSVPKKHKPHRDSPEHGKPPND